MNFDKKILVNGFEINEKSPTYVIAEAGVNHGGDMNLAKQLVDVAVEAGAHAVKFQAFRTKSLILENVSKAPYQQETTNNKESQSLMLKKLELSKNHYKELKDYCEEKGIAFLITPFDEDSLEELEEIGVEAYKVASTDTTNLPFLRKIAEKGKPIILSTGMCFLEEVERALMEIHQVNRQVILLQCTANYPIKDEEANLNVLHTFQNFNAILGYSDHSVGLGAALYAIPMGAKVLEKHFTLNKDLDGPDHRASLSPKELKAFMEQVQKVDKYLGSAVKEPTESEMATRQSLQKCLVSFKAIKKGEVFSEENIIAKRTGGEGISPIKYYEVLGKKASRDFEKNEIIHI